MRKERNPKSFRWRQKGQKIKGRLNLLLYSLMALIWLPAPTLAHEGERLREVFFINPFYIIAGLGTLTFSLLLTTFLIGKFMFKDRARLFVWHKRAAFATIFIALLHLLSVLFLH